jgi:hypothetical protein
LIAATTSALASYPHSTQQRRLNEAPSQVLQQSLKNLDAAFEQLLLQGQCTIEDKTTRTGETTHLMPLLSVRPQFKPISLAESIVPDRLESGAHASYANLRAGRLEAGRRVPAFKVSVALAFRVLESAPRAVPPQCP